MSSSRLPRSRRALSFILFRLVPLLMLLACVVFAVQLLDSFIARTNEQSTAQRRQPLFEQTATALAASAVESATPAPSDQGRGESRNLQLVSWNRPADLNLQFETNTPQPASEATQPPAPTAVPTVEMTLPASEPTRPLPTVYFYSGPVAAEAGGTAVPTAVQPLDRYGNDLMNIALLGHDGELTEDGFIRTDTIIIVSINRTTGTVAMLTLPRDLYVYIPGWTMQRINLAYIHGETGGWTDGGFGLLRQTLLYNLGINIHYYAMVNLTGFKAIVDSIGGVDLAVDCAIEDLPLIEAEVPAGAVPSTNEDYYVLPVGYYHMSGAEALWYARSRHSSSDFDRGRRQQQLLRAIWRKARDTGLLSNVIPMWNEGGQYVETNLALEDILGLVPLALSIDSSQIDNYRLARTYHTIPWQPPDGSNVQLPVYDTMRQLLQDFYTPPTENQLQFRAAAVHVYNGSGNTDWDRVAAERLAWDGIGAIGMGPSSEQVGEASILIDYTGRTKGSSAERIARVLNILPENIRQQPDPNRTVDFEVILGSGYTSCIEDGVLAVGG
ncbi:MAG: LCP family protein [Chloroflexi bacterium]|nr:LCP family protein [Chloroflexota bacterium]